MGLGNLHPIEHGFSTGRGGSSLVNIEQGHSLVIPKDLIGVIRKLGLTTNLKLVLDAGDASSYNAAVQTDKWLDRAGSGYDFFRGSGTGVDAADPTFNGTAGGLSSAEYWGFDGGDYFTYDTTNESWMENIHKDNAKFSIFSWFYIPSSGSAFNFCGTDNNGFNGFHLRAAATTFLVLRVSNATGAALTLTGTNAVPATRWNCAAVTLDEAVGASGAAQFLNGATETFTSTYSTPSAAAASFTMNVAARGNAGVPPASGARLGGIAIWEGVALTAAQLTAIYTATRGRYGV